jgi:hypothetical protein
MISSKPVSGPRGSAEGLKDYFRIADHPGVITPCLGKNAEGV